MNQMIKLAKALKILVTAIFALFILILVTGLRNSGSVLLDLTFIGSMAISIFLFYYPSDKVGSNSNLPLYKGKKAASEEIKRIQQDAQDAIKQEKTAINLAKQDAKKIRERTKILEETLKAKERLYSKQKQEYEDLAPDWAAAVSELREAQATLQKLEALHWKAEQAKNELEYRRMQGN